MNDNPFRSPDTTSRPPSQPGRIRLMRLVVYALLGCLFGLAVLLAIAVWSHRVGM